LAFAAQLELFRVQPCRSWQFWRFLSLPFTTAFHGAIPMIIVFNCPHCEAILRMKEQYGGQRGRCPQCQGAITVPAIETDAGMDLMPLEPTAPTPATAEPAPPAAAPLFSIESRFRSLAGAMASESAAGAAPPSSTGDSNIGLAPVDDSPASAKARPAAPTALDPPPRADKSNGLKETGPSDSTIGLAPVDDGPMHAIKTPPPPPVPAKPAASEPDDENFGLAPLEDSAHKSSARPATPASAGASSTANGSAAAASATAGAANGATTDSKSDVRITVVCDGCGAKMRVPPTAAGRQLACPRCKKKLRVPEGPAASSTVSDTRPLQDTPSSSSGNLDMGMLDEMEGAGPAADAPAAALRAPGAKGKSKGKTKSGLIGQSKQNTVLGMPPLVVYGGAVGGLLLLIGGLAIVYFVTKPAAPPTPGRSPTVVAQTPAAGTPASAKPATGAPAPSPGAAPVTPIATTQPAPGAQPGAAPMPVNPSAPAATPGTAAPPATSPVAATPPPAQRVEWRNRIPVVRLTTGRYKSEQAQVLEEGEVAVERLTVPSVRPRVEPTPAEIKALLPIAPTIINTQKAIETQLTQMTDLASTKQRAGQWAEMVERGLDLIRKNDRLSGIDLPTNDRESLFKAMLAEEGTVMTSQGELERLAHVPGAIEALETALKERAAREPTSALADTLKQAQPQ
jgi:hypothetical protein